MKDLLTTQNLLTAFGTQSAIAQRLIPELVNAIDVDMPQYQQWRKRITPQLPKRLNTRKLAKPYTLTDYDDMVLLFAVQTYYATMVTLLAGTRLAPITTINAIADGTHFQSNHVANLAPLNDYNWVFDSGIALDDCLDQANQFDMSQPPPDVLKALYQNVFPRKIRHTLGEYYTPDWLAQHTLNQVGWDGTGRLLDPTCGSGTFLVLALKQLAYEATPLDCIAGVDVNPLACLSAKANLILHLGKPKTPTTLPIYCADVLLNPPELGTFDTVVGNPPWVNWETLPYSYRQATRHLWKQQGLFTHKGMDTILGKGKKDLSLLLTLTVMERYLCEGGKLGFVLTQSALKTSGAAEGFRYFLQGHPVEVHDFSRMRVFTGAETNSVVMTLQKGYDASYPIPYYLHRKHEGRTIKEDIALTDVQQQTKTSHFVAEPMNGLGSLWLTGKPNAIDAVRCLLGESDYTAHAGAYTGGANAVYWLEVIGREGDTVRVRNIIGRAKRKVQQVEATIESDWVFPLLRGTDVERWRATPGAHILIVQDPATKQGYPTEWLRKRYPLTYAYLAQFETALRSRAMYKRYFKPTDPFYTMFNVGEYTFAPIKVVWQGFGTGAMKAAVVKSQASKPIMSNQAMHPFIGLTNESEAHYLAALLNSAPFEYAVMSHTQPRGKSFAQPGLLQRLRLPQYDHTNDVHRALTTLSRAAHIGHVADDSIAQSAAAVWGLSDTQLADVVGSLQELRS